MQNTEVAAIVLFLFHSLKNKVWVNEFRYGGFSLGARSSQVLPPAEEIDDAISRVREIFSLEKVSQSFLLVHN